MTLPRTVLRVRVREVLLERILKGELQPGDRLLELRLAEELGTSQAPVREALRELQSLGFVEYEPYKGTRVRRVTEEEIAEIFPVRIALEELAAYEAAGRLGGRADELEEEFLGMVKAAGRGDLNGLAAHDATFHRLIVGAAGNRVLFDTWRTLRVEARVVITVLKTDLDLTDLAEMHRPLLVAIAAASPKDAAREMRRHFEVLRTMMNTDVNTQTVKGRLS